MNRFAQVMLLGAVVLAHAALFRLALVAPGAGSAASEPKPDRAEAPVPEHLEPDVADAEPIRDALSRVLDASYLAAEIGEDDAGNESSPHPPARDDGRTGLAVQRQPAGVVLAMESGSSAQQSRRLGERLEAAAAGSLPAQLLVTRMLAPAPEPRANWALALAGEGLDAEVFGFFGLGPGKGHQDVASDAFAYVPESDTWRRLPAPPVPAGRLASAAVALGGELLVIGGYTVAADGSEVSTPDILAFDPGSGQYRVYATMPVPVDDSVALVWRQRYLVLVSGWSNQGNVADVQLYDSRDRRWIRGTPWPGEPVFGHAGGLAGDRLVACDGVTAQRGDDGRNRFALTDACFLGELDPAEPGHIDWRQLPPHPGPALYRAAASATTAHDGVLFAGGATRAYNYDGIGYDGVPATASRALFSYRFAEHRWLRHPDLPVASMDHRALIRNGGEYLLIGGMRDPQRVSAEGIGFRLPRAARINESP